VDELHERQTEKDPWLFELEEHSLEESSDRDNHVRLLTVLYEREVFVNHIVVNQD
jgi:hypothetical protein